jgi:hypothetical protein
MSDDTDRINTNDGRAERVRGLERLPRRRAPERDLWPGIEARLKPRRSHYPVMQYALAASLVAGLAAVFATSLREAAIAPVEVAAAAPPQLTDDSRAIVEANLSMVRTAERQLRQALRQDPDSTALRSLLASAQNRQLALRALL